jgi:hypothetical protein
VVGDNRPYVAALITVDRGDKSRSLTPLDCVRAIEQVVE